MTTNLDVAVFGAYGHTGHFVVAELLERGYAPILIGRDPAKLSALSSTLTGLESHQASADDAASLDRPSRSSASSPWPTSSPSRATWRSPRCRPT
jgi:short-subunit dehydrogenase